ncbi:two-component system, response regulator YesN [Evansella caseinilytica]|uniref:Two-component system, response regulator YesN n=1 Tax=Evansella caseinilytica TaxID=1503961 RepID=A0A1H3R0K7_9BACI|nr:response regulator transcription factor [Evansella caseinilytica]SDZ19043.1 two-component system, response regulator YesN [Evansella caseinilytica]
MYKVLIVDDEPVVRVGLKTLITWEDYGFQVVGLAGNGLEAYLMYQNHSPDLIISDIRMTGMDGLELIKKIRDADTSIQFLILSGYADFNYARKAITSDVAGYMLKPVDEDELIEYLQSIKETLRHESERKQLEYNDIGVKREQLLLSGLSYGGQEVLEEITAPVLESLDLSWSRYAFILIKLEEPIDAIGHPGLIKQLLQKYFQQNQGVVFWNDPYLVVMTNRTYSNGQRSQRLYNELRELIHPDDIGFYAALGPSVTRFCDLGQAYEDALQLMKNKFFHDTNGMITSASLVTKPVAGKEVDAGEIIEKLYFAADVGRKDLVESLLQDIIHCNDELCEKKIKNAFVKILSGTISKLSGSTNEREREEISRLSEQVIEVYQQRNIAELVKFSKQLMEKIMKCLSHGDTETQMKKMIDFINRRYNENLKLETLAEVFNYNSAYLGKLFKNFTGEYFNTYLDKIRIENGKKLLLDGYKVYQVAEAIGYSNVDYFHSKFKKYEKISPSAYRRQYMQQMNKKEASG